MNISVSAPVAAPMKISHGLLHDCMISSFGIMGTFSNISESQKIFAYQLWSTQGADVPVVWHNYEGESL